MARKQGKTLLVFAPRVIRAFLGFHGLVAGRECFQPGRGEGVLGLIDGMCRRSLRTPTHYNIIVWSVAKYRPHVSHF